jgi:putative Mn2+ efflux pump MntP
MPAIGWFAGLSLRNLISELDHWIAFVLLAAIGGKMIYESFKLESDKKHALVVGVTFAFLNIAIVWPVLIIGLITFVTSFIGVFIGDKFGHIFESKIELVGGLILIAVGLKILLEHLL